MFDSGESNFALSHPISINIQTCWALNNGVNYQGIEKYCMDYFAPDVALGHCFASLKRSLVHVVCVSQYLMEFAYCG